MARVSGIITKLMQVAEIKPNPVNFDDVAALADGDMEAVNRLIRESLESDVALVSQVSEYIVMSGGKRLRPLIVLLAARALGYDGDQHVRAATIIEFIHTATSLTQKTPLSYSGSIRKAVCNGEVVAPPIIRGN